MVGEYAGRICGDAMMLSREQVEFIQGCLTMACVAGQLPKDALEAMMPVFENDAALRERVEHLEQINFDHELGFHAANTEIIDLTAHLATLTTAHQQAVTAHEQERDTWIAVHAQRDDMEARREKDHDSTYRRTGPPPAGGRGGGGGDGQARTVTAVRRSWAVDEEL